MEPTKIRRCEKLIGSFYRNELARRLEALGMAVTPRMVGRVPGFELAGYEQPFLDAFSGRRAEIVAYLEEHDLPYPVLPPASRCRRIASVARRDLRLRVSRRRRFCGTRSTKLVCVL